MDELALTLELDRRIHLRGARETIDIPEGFVALHPTLPDVRFLNAVVLPGRLPEDLDAPALRALADHWLGHLPERLVVIEDAEAGERLAPDLLALGSERRRTALMVYRGDPGELPRDPRAREVTEAELRALQRATLTEADPVRAGPPGLAEQLLEAQASLRAGTPARGFGAGEHGELQSMCTLFLDPDVAGRRIAMVEEVATLSAHRERGLARAVVSCAVREALRWRADLITVPADAEDLAPAHLRETRLRAGRSGTRVHAPGPCVADFPLMPKALVSPGVQDSILDTIGGTPLVRLSRIGAGLRPQILAKLEVFNPGGSIKDRIAVSLIEAAERDGKLRPGGTIVEPTSGNTGTGLAIAARLKGYRVIAVMPDKMSREKIDLLRAYGAEVVMAPTDVPPDSPQAYYRVADRLTEEIPGAFQPNQYANPANPQAHYESTGPELWEQIGDRMTHFVAGVGTGGTITGTVKYLREHKPDIVVVGADPEGSIYSGGEENVRPYLVEGVGEDFWPRTFDPSVVDRWVAVSDRDSFLTTRRLAQAEGILAGGSGGLALHAALVVAAEIEDPDAVVVVIIPDGGRSYLSKIYSDPWMRQYGFLERGAELTVGDVLRRKQEAGEIPELVTVETHFRVRDAVALLHEHRVSQLPVISAHDPHTIVGAIGERGLLKHAAQDPSLLDAQIIDVMEPPFAAVSSRDPVREAVELLVGEQQALLVTQDGRAAGLVTRTDLLEALAT
jgi:cystathionine beta-synthase